MRFKMDEGDPIMKMDLSLAPDLCRLLASGKNPFGGQ